MESISKSRKNQFASSSCLSTLSELYRVMQSRAAGWQKAVEKETLCAGYSLPLWSHSLCPVPMEDDFQGFHHFCFCFLSLWSLIRSANGKRQQDTKSWTPLPPLCTLLPGGALAGIASFPLTMLLSDDHPPQRALPPSLQAQGWQWLPSVAYPKVPCHPLFFLLTLILPLSIVPLLKFTSYPFECAQLCPAGILTHTSVLMLKFLLNFLISYYA